MKSEKEIRLKERIRVKGIVHEKKKVLWLECLLGDTADDVYKMVPVDLTAGCCRLDAVWKAFGERFDIQDLQDLPFQKKERIGKEITHSY